MREGRIEKIHRGIQDVSTRKDGPWVFGDVRDD